MGKSTATRMFADEGVPVTDADTIVHRLYEGRAVPLVGAAFPGVVRDGAIDRQALSECLVGDSEAFAKLESIVHPLVREEQAAFIDEQRRSGSSIVLIDVPLLFETGGEDIFDRIVVVSCAPELQRKRVLTRPGMTEEKFEAILRRQIPDAAKRACADFVIETDGGMDDTRAQVRAVLGQLRQMAGAET